MSNPKEAPPTDAMGMPIAETLTSEQVQSLHDDHGLYLGEVNLDMGVTYAVKISQRTGKILKLNRRIVCAVLDISPHSPAVEQAQRDGQPTKWCRIKI